MYLQCYRSSLRVDIHLSRQNAELQNERLLNFHLPVGKNTQLYGARPLLSIAEEEGAIHRFSDVCVESRKGLSAVWAADDPSHLSQSKTGLS